MQYKVLKDFGDTKAGEVISCDVGWDEQSISDRIVDGMIEPIKEEEETKEKNEIEEEKPRESTGPVVELQRYFTGKRIVSDTTREVEGRIHHHLRLEDGTEYDLTAVEYEQKIITQK